MSVHSLYVTFILLLTHYLLIPILTFLSFLNNKYTKRQNSNLIVLRAKHLTLLCVIQKDIKISTVLLVVHGLLLTRQQNMYQILQFVRLK